MQAERWGEHSVTLRRRDLENEEIEIDLIEEEKKVSA